MVALTNPPTNHLSLKPTAVPAIDMSSPTAAIEIATACEDLGFFKITNHGISKQLVLNLEKEAAKFFSLSGDEKAKGGPALPFGYGNKRIGLNGDMGWVEYLLLEVTSNPLDFLKKSYASSLRSALNDYISEMKKLSCELLELMAEGLGIKPRDAFSKFVTSGGSDRMLRLNHYPPRPQLQGYLTGFGEHTDPQIISILRSNNCSGFEIALKDGRWIPVPPDHDSFFVNVGDMLQVMTNGRFKSVRHRVITKGYKSRLSMIYFSGPSATQVIKPLPQVLNRERSRYKEFTWSEYKKAAYNSKLADNRLAPFEDI